MSKQWCDICQRMTEHGTVGCHEHTQTRDDIHTDYGFVTTGYTHAEIYDAGADSRQDEIDKLKKLLRDLMNGISDFMLYACNFLPIPDDPRTGKGYENQAIVDMMLKKVSEVKGELGEEV